MKKIFSIFLVLVLVVSTLGGCTKPQEKAPVDQEQGQNGTEKENDQSKEEPMKVEKIRVAYHPNLGGAATVVTAKEMGYFEEEGLDVDLVQFTAGPPEIAAMVSGDLDIGYIGPGAHFLAAQGKVNVVALDLLGKSDELLGRKDLGIETLKDLKGKTVAATLGTSAETVLNLALDREGIDPNEIKIINMDVSGAVAAFTTGKVDAAAMWAPYTAEVKKQLGEKVVKLADNDSFRDQYVFPGSWVATPKWIKDNEDIVVRFNRAVLKAMDYRYENIDQVIEWVAKFNGTPIDSAKAEKDSVIFLTSKEIYDAFSTDQAYTWFTNLTQIFVDSEQLEEKVPGEKFVIVDYLIDAYEGINKEQ